jgi:hypothetical protein
VGFALKAVGGVVRMNILIKDMEMPKNCKECFACKAELSQEKKVIYVCCFAQTDCPLVPVPPHGRCIDADALMSGVDDGDDVIFVWAITDAPTIIEAEGGET